MATLSTAQQALLQSAIDLMEKGTARETPFAQDVIQRLGLLADSEGGLTSGLLFEAARDNPVSLLIALVAESGYEVLSSDQEDQLFDAIEFMRIGTAYETPFAEDVIQRLAPVAHSSGFMTTGGFYEAIKDKPISTMLRWALKLGSE